MKKQILVIAVALFVVCMYACVHKGPNVIVPKKDTTSNNNNNNNNNNNHDTTSSFVDTSVCFQRDILPIFLGSCAISGCHSAASHKGGYTFTSYATIVSYGISAGHAASSTVYTACLYGSMPKSPIAKLDSTKLSLMSRWINNGAANDTNCAARCDTSKYTYAAAIAPLLQFYCYSCHASGAAASSGGGIVLDNYTSLLVQVQNGKLLGDLQHLSGYNAMPQIGSKLEDCQITQVSNWIKAGAPNN